jgi:hypothetical protein
MSGLDCSGLVVEILKSSGALPGKGDWTAEELSKRFEASRVATPIEGCLLFWGTAEKTRHVEYALSPYHTIGAMGGGSSVVSLSEAIGRNAFVKVRPIADRLDGLMMIVDPFVSMP